MPIGQMLHRVCTGFAIHEKHLIHQPVHSIIAHICAYDGGIAHAAGYEICWLHDMPQLRPQRGPRDPSSSPPGQFPASGYTASSRPLRAKAKTWIRPQSADNCASSSNHRVTPVQLTQQSVGSSASSLSSTPQVDQTFAISRSSQQTSYVSRKKNTLTRVQPGVSSRLAAGTGISSQSVSQETRRLIHQGRHKLIQQPQQNVASLAVRARTPTTLQQYRQFVRTQSRKRPLAGSSAPAAKRQNTWVRSSISSAAVPASAASTGGDRPTASSYVRSTHSHKLQLVRRRLSAASTLPATPTSRVHSRGTVLAKQLLSARSLKRKVRPALHVRNAGIAKPGKLQRIAGVLYKVGGSGLGRSLQRQVTPKGVRPLLSPEVRSVFMTAAFAAFVCTC